MMVWRLPSFLHQGPASGHTFTGQLSRLDRTLTCLLAILKGIYETSEGKRASQPMRPSEARLHNFNEYGWRVASIDIDDATSVPNMPCSIRVPSITSIQT